MEVIMTNTEPKPHIRTVREHLRGHPGCNRPAWERADLAARTYVQQPLSEARTLQQLAIDYDVSVASIQSVLNGDYDHDRL
jgi:hypothetical protein